VRVNTYYPPNQPRRKRVYAFGQAVRKGRSESWGRESAGAHTSASQHFVIDEEIVRDGIDGLKNKRNVVPVAAPKNARRHLEILIGSPGRSRNENLTILIRDLPTARQRDMVLDGFAYWNLSFEFWFSLLESHTKYDTGCRVTRSLKRLAKLDPVPFFGALETFSL